MLVSCPECRGTISDKALMCPHCGLPISAGKPSSKVQSKKRMRLPNGFGRITEIKNKKLRKPFRVMISDGKDEHGRPIGRLLKPVSYFETYNEAYAALMKYNENPYDFSNDITMEELFDRWFSEHEKTLSASRIRQIKAAWKYCAQLYDKKVQTIRIRDLKPVIESGYKIDKNGDKIDGSSHMRMILKTVLSNMLDYAVEYEIIQHNYVKDIKNKSDVNANDSGAHMPFEDSEMKIIKSNLGSLYFDIIFVSCYMGWRPTEILELEVSKVNLTEWSIVGGIKTKAGKNRVVPIHSTIRDTIQRYYSQAILNGCSYLFSLEGERMSYSHYLFAFKQIIKKYGMNENHTPHDCRKHFVTMAKRYDVNEYAIKKIVGHSVSDITEKIYTVRDVKWLHEEINKIQ